MVPILSVKEKCLAIKIEDKTFKENLFKKIRISNCDMCTLRIHKYQNFNKNVTVRCKRFPAWPLKTEKRFNVMHPYYILFEF